MGKNGSPGIEDSFARSPSDRRRSNRGKRSIRLYAIMALALVGLAGWLLPPRAGQTPPPDLDQTLRTLTDGQRFNLFRWEVDSVSGKLADLVVDPASVLDPAAQQSLVRQFLAAAQQVRELERAIDQVYSDPAAVDPEGATLGLRAALESRRGWLDGQSRTVEAILERQLARLIAGAGLDTAGVVWPPPRLRFTEPPQLLVLSPRDHIERLRSVDLSPQLDSAQRDELEQNVASQLGLAAYVTDIGGYGVWPTMVVDRFGLPWTIETIAHEWVHNYLAFHRLGWGYLEGGEAVTINETVASIVGEELGWALMAIYYPDLLPPPAPPDAAAPQDSSAEEPAFDFNREMRATRQVVDRLLANGYIDEAEAYMEARRQRFVANGYPLRVLNQAYFAFHGSYATSPGSVDPIGPKLRHLRELSPSLADFLRTTAGMTSVADIDAATQRLEQAGLPPDPT